MLKTMLLTALAAVSVSAIAQDNHREDGRYSIDATGKSQRDIKREVCRQAEYLSAGDQYDFNQMLDRLPATVENTIVSGLFAAHRQSVIIHSQMVMVMMPNDAVVMDSVKSDDQVILAQESEESMRPMRMIMQHPRYRDIDYDTALEILGSKLNETEKTQLDAWWNSDTMESDRDVNERQKDIIVRLLKINAAKADEVVYMSCCMTHKHFMVK